MVGLTNSKQLLEPGYVSLLIAGTLYVAAVNFEINQLWGFNFSKFLPFWYFWLTIILFSLSALPPILNRAARWLEIGSLSVNSHKTVGVYLPWVLSMALFPILVASRSATNYLGDGTLRLNQISGGKLWLPTEAGDFYLHAILSQHILKPLGYSTASSYYLVSGLCGALFLVGSFHLARYLWPRQMLLAWMMMISSGMTVMFFGYVESYAIVASMLPFAVLFALRVVDGKLRATSFVVIFLLAAIIHPVSLVLLSGMLLSVVGFARLKDVETGWRVTRWLTGSSLGFIGILYLARATGAMDVGRFLMPLQPIASYQQGLLTANHFLNLFNWACISAIPALSLIFVVARGTKRVQTDAESRRKLLAAWMMFPSALFLFFFTPQLGGPRDWDLFSLAVFMFIPALMIWTSATGERRLPNYALVAVVLSLCLTVSFVSVNASVKAASDRFAEIIEVARFKNLYKEYATLYNYAKKRAPIRSRRLKYAQMAWSQPPYNKTDSVYMATELARIYLTQNNQARAREMINAALIADSSRLGTHELLVKYLREFGSEAELSDHAERLALRFDQNPEALALAGEVFLEVEHYQRAEETLAQAWMLDSTAESVKINYAISLYHSRQYDRSLALLEGAIIEEAGGGDFRSCYYAASASRMLGDSVAARKYLKLADHYQVTVEDSAMLIDLKALIQK